MARITVKHRHGQSFDVRVRGHALISDEPVTVGGDDEGPTPTELMVAGLAACAADQAVKRLAAVETRFEPMEVRADFDWDSQECRLRSIRLKVIVPDGISANAREEVLQAMQSCPARKMLVQPPSVEYELSPGPTPAMTGPALAASSWPREPAPDADSQDLAPVSATGRGGLR